MKKILLLVISLFTAFLVYWFVFKKENVQNYANHITNHRYQQAEFFRYSPQSPFLKYQKDFTYLDYFPANVNLRVDAKFIKSNVLDTLKLATSTGTIENYLSIGEAQFTLRDTSHSLLVLRSANPDEASLFIPFLDKTSGSTTYGGGRYLNVELLKRDKMLLDFNKSYNPYCAYIDDYTCPLPPKENRLSIYIEAGEKAYQGH